MRGMPIRQLECACCGAHESGRQWWNRDAGYGVCVRCATENTNKYGENDTLDMYGVKGVNWGLGS